MQELQLCQHITRSLVAIKIYGKGIIAEKIELGTKACLICIQDPNYRALNLIMLAFVL